MNLKGKHHQSIEAGDFYDNLYVFEAVRRRINMGERGDAIEEIRQLRDHILQSKEIKSVTHLLPEIEAAIESVNEDKDTSVFAQFGYLK